MEFAWPCATITHPERKPLLFSLHGLCLTQASWSLQVRYLTRRWGPHIRILTYDHRGHGASAQAPVSTYTIDQLADDLTHILTALDVHAPLTLVTHSMGGLADYYVNVRYVRGEPLSPCGERVLAMRSAHSYWGGEDLLEGGFTVRRIGHAGGRQSYWIFTPSGELHRPSLDVLTQFGPSTQQTYAYSLVDHLNWLHVNRKSTSTVTLDDLRRYMNGLTGQADGVYGVAWRAPEQKPLGPSAAANVATIVKVYYLALAAKGEASTELADGFEAAPRSPKRKGSRVVSSNPLAPRKSVRRPRFLADAVVQSLFEPSVLTTARDLMIVTWLRDGGLRVGAMCGLRFRDLHLTEGHACGQRADPHVHIVGRDDNPNRARAKAYAPADLSPDGYVLDGVIRAVSPAMISTFYGYLLDEYHGIAHLVDHEQVLVHLQGVSPGQSPEHQWCPQDAAAVLRARRVGRPHHPSRVPSPGRRGVVCGDGLQRGDGRSGVRLGQPIDGH